MFKCMLVQGRGLEPPRVLPHKILRIESTSPVWVAYAFLLVFNRLEIGAAERTRTSTPLRETAPKAVASANSATAARIKNTTLA